MPLKAAVGKDALRLQLLPSVLPGPGLCMMICWVAFIGGSLRRFKGGIEILKGPCRI